MSALRVEKVPVPEWTLVTSAFPRVDYADAYRIRLPTSSMDVDGFVRCFFGNRPGWIRRLMRLRDAVVSPFGLKTAPRQGASGFFQLQARTGQEVLLGQDDRHLDFRVSFLVRDEPTGRFATATTVVRFHNVLGRLYFFFVKRLHPLIVRAMLRRALAGC